MRLGWSYKFGIKLAKRQVFVNENLRLGRLGGFNLKFGVYVSETPKFAV